MDFPDLLFFLPVPQVWTREAGIQATATVGGAINAFRYVACLCIFSLSLAWHGIDLKTNGTDDE